MSELDITPIPEEQIPMRSIAELKGLTFSIPSQQRGYKWTSSNIKELIDDLREFMTKPEKPLYCLQPLAIVKIDELHYSVLDGQQRLTTLYLLYKYLSGEDLYTLEYERDEDDEESEFGLNRQDFLQNIAAQDEKEADQCIDFYFIWNAFKTIGEEIKQSLEKEDFLKLLNAPHTEKSVQLIWYEVPSSKRYETFRNLNSGKIELSNTELIKALFMNRVTGLKGAYRYEAAILFEQMEEQLREDRFWFMFNSNEVKARQNRLDFIFNLVAKCKDSDYETDPRRSFRNYFDMGKGEGKTLEEKWKEVRDTYLRIRDLYEDIYTYHYVGFLTYVGSSSSKPAKVLGKAKTTSHSGLRKELRKDIKKILKSTGDSVESFNYDSGAKTLRQFFVIYNIETILSRYEQLKSERKLQHTFERFPFELLHSQSWDIEHIASKKNAKFESAKEREEWLESIKIDLGKDIYGVAECQAEAAAYSKEKKAETFMKLYNKIIAYWDSKHKDDAIPDPNPDASDGERRRDKNQIGNLTLLDSHTNRSFHNSLFPRKRGIVIAADGLKNSGEHKEDEGVQIVYIPFATRQCFTKAYRRGNNVNLNYWGQRDAEAYLSDLHLKLDKYFKESDDEL